MPLLTCHYPGGYSGIREPGGNPRLRLDLAEGATAVVSEAKAAQLLRDFPGYFTAAAPRIASDDQAAPGTSASTPRRRRATKE